MMKNDLAILFEPALRPKDFHEVDLSKQQLRVWTDLTGFQPAEREEGKWRKFSPADVLRLSLMRELKGRTGLAITEHPSLVSAIGGDDFVLKGVTLWTSAKRPCLLTDLDADHRLVSALQIDATALLHTSTLWCLLDLAPAINLMRLAVVRGGTDAQRLLCHELEVAREAASFVAPAPARPTASTTAPMPVGRKARVLDFQPDEAPSPQRSKDE